MTPTARRAPIPSTVNASGNRAVRPCASASARAASIPSTILCSGMAWSRARSAGVNRTSELMTSLGEWDAARAAVEPQDGLGAFLGLSPPGPAHLAGPGAALVIHDVGAVARGRAGR